MSTEVYELLKQMDIRSFNMQLVLQCAPVISGLKLSNLLIISRNQYGCLRKILKNSGLSSYILLDGEEKMTILIYDKEMLNEYLDDIRVSRMLQNMGYQEISILSILQMFRLRYEQYTECGGEFPHEMGIILGYPIEDVDGFIKNNGRNCLYTGYWKVYSGMKQKLRLFRRFEEAQKTMLELLSTGFTMEEVIHIYKGHMAYHIGMEEKWIKFT